MMSGVLRNRSDQYEARRDDKGTWRIVNLWDSSLAQFGPDDDIPDIHQSVTILTEAQFLAVIKEANRMGILEKAIESNVSEEYEVLEKTVETLETELADVKVKLFQAEKQPKSPPYSEAFEFRTKALEALLKLSAMG